MEQPAANSPQVRGKDLVGGIKVMPMGLGDHIKKRTSGEFKSEQRGGNLQFSNADKSSSHAVKESKQLTSFMEESSHHGGFQPASSLKTSSQKQASFMQSSAQKTSAMSSSKEFMPSNQMASSQMASSQMASSQIASSQMASFQMASSQMASSQMASSQMSSSSRSFSKTLSSSESKTTSMKSSEWAQKELHSDMPSQQFGLEIGQNELKTQIESAITDLEQDRDFVDYDKENQPIKLTSPPQNFSPPPAYASQPKQASLDMFSPPPLEPMDPPEVMVTPHILDQAPPTRNLIQNGFSEFSSSSSKAEESGGFFRLRRPGQFAGRVAPRPISMPVDLNTFSPLELPEFSTDFSQRVPPVRGQEAEPVVEEVGEDIQDEEYQLLTTTEVQEMSQVTESSIQLAQVMNGGLRQEDSSSIQGSNSSSSLLQKIMTPASVEYDTGSLKRRDPRKMFTDSSFYSAKHHPTVADQVEMAHKLSAAMFSKENKTAKGQQMFLNRAQNAGDDVVDDGPRHDTVPNLKLVMNPEGKIHEWGDMPDDQLPDAAQVASHAAHNCPNLNSPDINPVAEDLIGGVGKGGELFAKRKKRAENWIVDEASVGQKKPSAFADKFVQEQTQHQQIFQEQKQLEEHQRQQVAHQQSEQQRQQQMQQQQQSQQQFAAQQQFKQEQSLELRRQQEEQTMMIEQELELPANFKHTDLKARGCATPSLDLSCHNVQGINVWANTAPRGWGSMKRTTVTQKPAPPTLSLCPATPSVDQEQLQKQMEQARIQEEFEQHEREEQMYLEQQQLKMEQQKLEFEQREQNRIQQEEDQLRIHKEQAQMRIQQEQEQMRIQHEQEQKRIKHEQEQIGIQQQQEQMRIQQQQEQMRIQQQQEQMRIQQQQEQMRIQQQQEQLRIQQEEEERFRIQQEQQELRIKQEQEEMIRIQQQQEQLRIQQEQEEQLRIQQEQLRIQQEQMRIQQAQEEQLRIQQEQLRIQQEQEEQLRIQQEQLRIQQEQEEQIRVQQEQLRTQQEQELIAQQNAEAARKWEEAEAMRAQQEKGQQMVIQKQQEEEMRMLQLQQEKMIMQQEQARQEEAERQRQESLRLEDQRKAEMKQQQEQLLVTQQQTFSQQTSSIKSGASHSEQVLEARKRKEYEEWFRTQEKEALEYSASVKYQETASERHNASTEITTATSVSNSMMKQQHIVQTTGEQRSNLQQNYQLSMSKGVQQQQQQVVLPLLEIGAQLAQPPMTLPSFESSNMSSFQQHSSTQQSLSQTSTKQSMEIYESQRVGYGGVMMEQGHDQDKTFLRDSGVFGGISGDSNDLVGSDVDYKRHSVKDLAKHYALVKPKADIPINVLPEIKMYNGQQGPALNYLGDSSQGETRQTFVKKEVSQDEIDASKHAYEMKKKQQTEQHQQKKIEQTSQTTSSVAMRQQTSSTETKSQAVTSERRQSLTTALLMDPAQQHSQAGIIDPSAILRGGDSCDGMRAKSAGILGVSGAAGGATEDLANKLDNHNAIARGWGGMKENYHPVTFRNIYNVDSQKDIKNL